MLDIRIQNESLDLPPGAQMEIEENNPYLQFQEQVVGEYSLPIDVPATPKNVRLTKWASIYQKRLAAVGLEAVVFDSGFQHSLGKLKVEKVQHNLNRGEESRMSLYYLTGTSYFWQDVKGKTTRQADFGGDRHFGWDNFNRSGNGFWGHLHRVIDAPAGYGASGYDYAFFPLLIDNVEWAPNAGTQVINLMTFSNGQPVFSKRESYNHDANFITPFPYLKYVLKQVVAQSGWTIDGAPLNDPQFEKVVLINQRAINWAVYEQFLIKINYPPAGRPNISFNLRDHVPDVDVATFLMRLRNRFGWWYDIDRINKTVRVRKLGDVAASARKDMTANASPLITKTVLTEKKIFGVRNTSQEQELTLSDYTFDGDVAAYLPPATAAQEGHVRLVRQDNNFYIVQANDAGVWTWEKLAANTADVVPDGATEFLTGGTTVLSGEVFNGYLDFLMRSSNSGFWAARNDDNQNLDLIELCFYYGRQPNRNGQEFPFAHHHVYNSRGDQVGPWSLSFTGKLKDGTEIGLYALSFQPLLRRLVSSEEVEMTLYLTRADFMALKFSDVLNVRGVEVYVKQRKYTLPYKGSVNLQCLRVQP